MRTLEYIRENADQLSQQIIDARELRADPNFRELFEVARQYQNAKTTAENWDNTIALLREQTNNPHTALTSALESVRQKERAALERFARAFHALHANVRNYDGPGQVTFRANEVADVVCSTDQYGRVWVSHATGYPGWHPILLLHPAGPYRLTMNDGQEAQIYFRNLDGLVEVVN